MRERAFIDYQWKKVWAVVLYLGILLFYGLLDMFGILLDADGIVGELNANNAIWGTQEGTLLYLGRVSDGMSFYSHMNWIAAVFFAFSLFGEYGDDGRLCLFRSLPYTRKGLWRQSFLLGSGIVSAGYLVSSLAATVLYAGCYATVHDAYLYSPVYEVFCSIDTLGNAQMYILEEWVIALGIFSLAVFARMAMGHALAALLLLAGILTTPYLLLKDLGHRLSLRGSEPGRGIKALAEGMADLGDRLLASTAHLQRSFTYYRPSHYYDKTTGAICIGYCTYEWRTLFLWAAMGICAFFLAGRLTRREHAFSKIGKTPLMENLFILLAGLYPAVLVMCSMPGGIREILPMMLVVFLMMEGIMWWLFKGKRQKRYERWNTWRGGNYER